MQKQLEESRNSNEEMKAMILKLLNATGNVTDVPKESDSNITEVGSDEPDDSSNDSGVVTEIADSTERTDRCET